MKFNFSVYVSHYLRARTRRNQWMTLGSSSWTACSKAPVNVLQVSNFLKKTSVFCTSDSCIFKWFCAVFIGTKSVSKSYGTSQCHLYFSMQNRAIMVTSSHFFEKLVQIFIVSNFLSWSRRVFKYDVVIIDNFDWTNLCWKTEKL